MSISTEITRFMRRSENGYELTDSRPSTREMAKMQKDLQGKIKQGLVHKHNPGDGWHFLPSEPVAAFNGRYWWASFTTSEGAVLAHVEQICQLAGLDFDVLYRRAYPEEDLSEVTPEEREMLARPATLDDLPVVIDDLHDIHYYSLAEQLRQATAKKAL